MVTENSSCLEMRVITHILHLPTMSGLWASAFLFYTHTKNLPLIMLRYGIDKKNRKLPSSSSHVYDILCGLFELKNIRNVRKKLNK